MPETTSSPWASMRKSPLGSGAPVTSSRLKATPEPLVRGWSNRWYVSTIELGQGRVKEFEGIVDNEPNVALDTPPTYEQ